MALLVANHTKSTFNNSCRSIPVSKGPPKRKTRPTTTTPSISLPNLSPGADTDKWTPLAASGGENDWSGPAVPKGKRKVDKTATPPNSTGTSEAGRQFEQAVDQKTENYATLFQTLLESNCMLHKEIARLRRDHKRAMSQLAHFSSRDHGRHDGQFEQCQQCKGGTSPCSSSTQADLYSSFESGSEEKSCIKSKKYSISDGKPANHSTTSESEEDCYAPSVVYDTPEEFCYENSSDDESGKHHVRATEPYRITYISSSSSNESICTSSQYASPRLLVGRMWENFSVGDYTEEEALPSAGVGKEKKWAHRVTVPEPFSMTVRERNSLKKKTKSMLIAEKEQEEREALLDAKLRKPFHASPIPASTYLPLHGLINAKNAQRKELVKKMAGNMLKSGEKPFKFSRKEEERKQKKAAWLKQAEEQNIARFRGKAFKAKPVPPKLFQASVEEAQELEEYRRIRARIRAEELLAKSKSPFSVRQQSSKGGGMTTHDQCIPKDHYRPHHRKKFSFQPQITRKIPDYDKAYEKLQQQLLLKKQAKLTTVSEPFKLHTERRAKIRQPDVNTQSDSGIEDKGEKVPLLDDPPPYTPVMTSPVMNETARRRKLLAQEKLAQAMLRDAVEEDQRKARKKREKDFQKIVVKKSYNVNEFLQEKKRKLKIHEFR